MEVYQILVISVKRKYLGYHIDWDLFSCDELQDLFDDIDSTSICWFELSLHKGRKECDVYIRWSELKLLSIKTFKNQGNFTSNVDAAIVLYFSFDMLALHKVSDEDCHCAKALHNCLVNIIVSAVDHW